MTPKRDFLLIGDQTITPKESVNIGNFGKTLLFAEQDYQQQTWTRLWSVRVNKWFKKRFCATHPFWETYEISKVYWNISLMHDQAQKQETRFILMTFTYKNHIKKGKYGTT